MEVFEDPAKSNGFDERLWKAQKSRQRASWQSMSQSI